MLATLESVQILDTAERIAKMILNSDVVENYRQCLYKMNDNDKNIKKSKSHSSVHKIRLIKNGLN